MHRYDMFLQLTIEGAVGDREVVMDNLVLSPGPCSKSISIPHVFWMVTHTLFF